MFWPFPPNRRSCCRSCPTSSRPPSPSSLPAYHNSWSCEAGFRNPAWLDRMLVPQPPVAATSACHEGFPPHRLRPADSCHFEDACFPDKLTKCSNVTSRSNLQRLLNTNLRWHRLHIRRCIWQACRELAVGSHQCTKVEDHHSRTIHYHHFITARGTDL